MIEISFLQNQFDQIENFKTKKSFFGYGLYSGAIFFGMVIKSRLYFLVNDETEKAYLEFGMKPFSFKPVSRDLYYEVPEQIIFDKVMLNKWAKTSIAVYIGE